MKQQSIFNNSNNNVIEHLDAEFHDALEEFQFVDASSSFEEPYQSVSNFDPDIKQDDATVTVTSVHTPSSPSSAVLRCRRLVSLRNRKNLSQSQSITNPDGLIDLDPHNNTNSLNSKDNEKLIENLNSTTVNRSSDSHGSSVITSVNDDETVNADSPAVDSPNPASHLLFIIAKLVRVDFLSSDNKLLASIRKPCMLQFKSDPIRLLSTFLKLPSFLTGNPSETQTLNININGYTEKDPPLSCLRVVIEQWAEFAKGAGVPEIFSASLKLESWFSFLKRVLWYWKCLIYVWISVLMFIMELSFTMCCCMLVMFPWVRRVGGYSVNVASNEPPG